MKVIGSFILLFVIALTINAQSWVQRASMPGTARYGLQAFSINGIGYVGGTGASGSIMFQDLYSYNASLNVWDTMASFPGQARRVGIGFATDSFGYVGLGWSGSYDYTDFYKYDPWFNSWSQLPTYPGGGGRNSFGTSTDKKGYVGGGSSGVSTFTYKSDWWEYDPDANTWNQLSSFPFGIRVGGIAFSIGCVAYVGQGHNNSSAFNDLWAYNTQTDTWTQMTSFPGSPRLHASSFVVNGKAVVGGGYQLGTGLEFSDYYLFDPLANSWTALPSFSAGQRGLSEGFEALGNGYLTGGWNNLNVNINDLWMYSDTGCDTRTFYSYESCGPMVHPITSTLLDTTKLYIDTLSSAGGCYSLAITCFLLNEEYNDTIIVTACDSFQAPSGKTHTTSGIYLDSNLTEAGCDSLITIDLTVNYSWSDSINVSSCEVYLSPAGKTYTQSGFYIDTLLRTNNCDSTFYIALTINPLLYKIDTIAICPGDSFLFAGIYRSVMGTYYDTIAQVSTCDSVEILELIHNSLPVIDQQSVFCYGDSFLVGTNYFKSPGIYYDTIVYTVGCDSLLQVTLSYDSLYYRNDTISICSGDSQLIGNTYYSITGMYYDTIAQPACDSIHIVELIILNLPQLYNQVSICKGDSIMIGGNYVKTAGLYSSVINNPIGCDTVVNTTLSIDSLFAQDTVEICFGDSILIGSTYYSTPGTYYDTLPTSTCDSVIEIKLIVNNLPVKYTQMSMCLGDSILIDGNWEKQQGTYGLILNNPFGCDTMLWIFLSVDPWPNKLTFHTICEGTSIIINGNVITQTGSYSDTIKNPHGCDTLHSYSVNVISHNPTVLSFQGSLFTTFPASSFQWIDCQTGFPYTNADKYQFYPPTNGDYAVVVSKDGCIDTSDCFYVYWVGVEEVSRSNSFIISPNPVEEALTLTLTERFTEDVSMEIFDGQGRKVKEMILFNQNTQSINVSNLNSGVYFIRLSGNDLVHSEIQRFTKQ